MHLEAPKILVAGTFNNDLESGERMQLVLDEFKPEIIVGETNQLLDLKAETREMVWAVLFDECQMPQDIQEKWRAIRAYKEHLVAQNYAYSKRIPYFMIDSDDPVNKAEIESYAQMQLVKEMQETMTPEEIIEHVRGIVERRFNRLERGQSGPMGVKKYYSENFCCSGNRPAYAEDRSRSLYEELMKIVRGYPDARIFGFFDGTQIVRPACTLAKDSLGRKMQNLRYYLGERSAQYGMLVDLI